MSNDFSLARPPYSTVYTILYFCTRTFRRSDVTLHVSRFRYRFRNYTFYARAACRAGYALSWRASIVILLLSYRKSDTYLGWAPRVVHW